MIGKNYIKAVFLDRDGVINRERGHVCCEKDFEILPGVAWAVAQLNARGVKVLLATNQSGLARGLMSEEDLEVIHDKMRGLLAEKGGHLDEIYVSPWHPDKNLDGGVSRWLGKHEDRKPGVGMFRKALLSLGIGVDECVYVGDSGKDLEAARTMGMVFYGVRSAKEDELAELEKVHESLEEVVKEMMQKGKLED